MFDHSFFPRLFACLKQEELVSFERAIRAEMNKRASSNPNEYFLFCNNPYETSSRPRAIRYIQKYTGFGLADAAGVVDRIWQGNDETFDLTRYLAPLQGVELEEALSLVSKIAGLEIKVQEKSR